ncbi:MAG: hypothetical protein ACI9IT_002627 [Glaciecola sp.]
MSSIPLSVPLLNYHPYKSLTSLSISSYSSLVGNTPCVGPFSLVPLLMQILYAKILRPEVVLGLPYPVSFILKPSITLTTFFLKVSP